MSWHAHEPVTALRPVGDDESCREQQIIGCHGCDWRAERPPPRQDAAGFAQHLRDLEAPEFVVHYWAYWAELVEIRWGELSREHVARVLYQLSR